MTESTQLPRREDLPDGKVKITFATPIMLFEEAKRSVTLRPPTAGEIWEIGDPRSYIYNAEGLGTPYVDRARFKGWLSKLMVDHDADIIGFAGDAALGMLIEDVVLDFFQNARRRSSNASAPSLQQA